MSIRYFKYGYLDGWELNFIGKTYNLRIAKNQIAFWTNCNSVFNLLRRTQAN